MGQRKGELAQEAKHSVSLPSPIQQRTQRHTSQTTQCPSVCCDQQEWKLWARCVLSTESLLQAMLRNANNPLLNDGTGWHLLGCVPDAGIWYASLLMNHNRRNISPCMIYLDAMTHILEVNSSGSQQRTSTVSKCSSESEKSAVSSTGPTGPDLNQHTYLWLKTTLPMGTMSFTLRPLSPSETVLPVAMLYLTESDIRPITNEKAQECYFPCLDTHAWDWLSGKSLGKSNVIKITAKQLKCTCIWNSNVQH